MILDRQVSIYHNRIYSTPPSWLEPFFSIQNSSCCCPPHVNTSVLSQSLSIFVQPSFTSFYSCSLRYHSPASSNVFAQSPIRIPSLLFFDHIIIIKMVPFTTAEDHHIIRLKEQVGGTWESIRAAFAGLFPGNERRSGGLQVRYSRYLQEGKVSRAAALAYGKSSSSSLFSLLPALLSSIELYMSSIAWLLGTI